MKKILTLAIAFAAAATVATGGTRGGPDRDAVSGAAGRPGLRRRSDGDARTARSATSSRPARTVTFRAYAVDGKTHKVLVAKDVKYFYVTIPNQPNVKLKYDPSAPGATHAHGVDRHLDGAGDLSPGHRRLQGPRQERRAEVAGPVRPVPGLDLAADDQRVSRLRCFAHGPRSLQRTPDAGSLDVSLYVDSVNGTRPPRPQHRGRSAARRRTSTSAASSSCSAAGAWTWRAATSSRPTNVDIRHRRNPRAPVTDAQLGRARRDHEPRLVLDERLEYPDRLSARRHDDPCRLQDGRRQDRDLRLQRSRSSRSERRRDHHHERHHSLVTLPEGRRRLCSQRLGVLLLPATALGDPTPVAAPAIPGVAALPGPVVDPGKPGADIKVLKTDARHRAARHRSRRSPAPASPPARTSSLTWGTANVDWVLDPRADSVDYLGRKATKITVRLATNARRTPAARSACS